MTQFDLPLAISTTPIPGLLVVDLTVHGDNRGWFKENWQRAKMTQVGLPDFNPVQNNISFNAKRGTTRGLHAEPWDKYVSLASGSAFGVWVDLREGDTFGTVFTIELSPSMAVFVPKGVANGFQTLEDSVHYVYLVNDHWDASKTSDYRMVNLRDPDLALDWPIPETEWTTSPKDDRHPNLANVVPFTAERTLVLGAGGQLSNALQVALPSDGTVVFAGYPEIDFTDPNWAEKIDWSSYSVVINAAAYTAVDEAETRIQAAWAINATAVQEIAKRCIANRCILVHVSSDYVFDGKDGEPRNEDAPLAPLGVYGASKAAGDLCVGLVPDHYLVRTSWVVGEGRNFIRTMESLARTGRSVSVVDDQIGRLTFASDLAEFLAFLISDRPAFGTYNFTNSGTAMSWFDIARFVYERVLGSSELVSRQTTAEFIKSKEGPVAPRPPQSTLALDKTRETGFAIRDHIEALGAYLDA